MTLLSSCLLILRPSQPDSAGEGSPRNFSLPSLYLITTLPPKLVFGSPQKVNFDSVLNATALPLLLGSFSSKTEGLKFTLPSLLFEIYKNEGKVFKMSFEWNHEWREMTSESRMWNDSNFFRQLWIREWKKEKKMKWDSSMGLLALGTLKADVLSSRTNSLAKRFTGVF